MKVGFIGLGAMGLPMAKNILKKGFPLFVYNRTKEKALPLFEEGAEWASTPKELVDACDVIITMIANDQVLHELVYGTSGIFSSSKKSVIHISMSTVSPTLVTELEKKHQERGIAFLAAPVSGRPERAKEGSLWIFLSGEEQAKKMVQPILKTMSTQIYDLGENASAAALFKLCNNFMIASLIESFAEASTMLEKNGIPPQKAAEIWGTSLFNSPVFHSYTPMICKRNFEEGGFALKLGLKDMRLLHEYADRTQVPMPFLADIQNKMLTCMNLGKQECDWSVTAFLTRELSGLSSIKS